MRKDKFFWFCALTTLVSALISAGFSVYRVISNGTGNSLAMYGASRSLALLIVAFIALMRKSDKEVLTMALLMGLVQTFDAFIEALAQNPAGMIGPVVAAIVTFTSAILLQRKINS